MKRVVYVSTAVSDFDAATLAALVRHSAEANTLRDVTGVLLFSCGDFMQLLEGPETTIDTLMDRIEADPRHTWVSRLIDEPTDHRLFPDWGMALADFEHPPAASLAEFRVIADFLTHVHGPADDALVLGLLRHFRSRAHSDSAAQRSGTHA